MSPKPYLMCPVTVDMTSTRSTTIFRVALSTIFGSVQNPKALLHSVSHFYANFNISCVAISTFAGMTARMTDPRVFI